MTPNTIILILSTLLFLELMFKPRLEFTHWGRHCYLFYGRGVIRKTVIIY